MKRDVPPPEYQDRIDVLTGFAEDARERGEHMFYVRIPASIDPLERGDQFENPLNDALAAASLGEVTGGGSQLAEDGSIEYCGIDVLVTDREKGLALLCRTMTHLNVPHGTVIEEFLPKWRELTLTSSEE